MVVIILLQILAAIFLVLLNGLFVAAEFAFVRIRESSVEKLVDQGVKGSKSLNKVVEELDDYLAVTQLGITVSSLGLGWIGEPAFAALIETIIGEALPASTTHIIAFGIGFSIITFLHVVLGELVPKTLSIQLTEKISLLVAPPMRFFRFIFVPGIIVFNGTANWVTQLLGVPPANETEEKHNEEEIRNIIRSSTEQGLVDSSESEMINRIFEFDDTQLKEVMVPEPDAVTVEKGATINEAQELMNESNHTKLPILDTEDDSVEYVVDIRETIRAENLQDNVTSIGRDILVLPEVTSLDQALFKMKNDRSQIAAVVDEWGTFEGIVTSEDVVEEIVGDLTDKFDAEKQNIKKSDEDTYVVDGTTNLKKINQKIGTELQSKEMDTLSGWIMEQSKSVPEEDSVFTEGQYKLTVTDAKNNRVESVTFTPKKEQD